MAWKGDRAGDRRRYLGQAAVVPQYFSTSVIQATASGSCCPNKPGVYEIKS
jgi:hypothetical protein